MNRRYAAAGVAAGVVLVAGFIALRAVGLAGDVARAPRVERPLLIVAGLSTYAVTLLLYAMLWRTIMLRLDSAKPLLFDSIAAFCASWLGRYVPSSLPYVAGKFAFSSRIGHRPGPVASSILYENLLVISIGAASAMALIPLVMPGLSLRPEVVVVAIGASVGGLAMLYPPILRRLIGFASRILRRSAPSDLALTGGGLVGPAFVAGLALALNGSSFALLLAAFGGLSVSEFIAAAAIFNLAGVTGILVLPVPSGLGVREAVLIGMLQFFVPLQVATAAAIVARLGGICIDVALGLAGAARLAARKSPQRAAEVPPTPQREAA